MEHEKGSVTILITLVASVIITIGLCFIWLVKEHIKSSEGLRDKTEAIIKARSAYDDLIYLALTGQSTEKAILFDDEEITKLKSLPLDGTKVMITDGVFVQAQDSNGRLSLTTVNRDALERLVKNEKGPEAGAIFIDSFLDWIERGDLSRINGAKSKYYRDEGYPYTPRNYDLQYLEELNLIRGVDADLFKRLYPAVTILPTTGFNPNTAGDAVLKAFLNIGDSGAESIRNRLAHRAITSKMDLFQLTGKKIEPEFEQNWFIPSPYMDIIVSVGSPRSICRIKAGIAVGQGFYYPYFIHYWQEE